MFDIYIRSYEDDTPIITLTVDRAFKYTRDVQSGFKGKGQKVSGYESD